MGFRRISDQDGRDQFCDVTCDDCGRKLESETPFTDGEVWDYLQGTDVLHVKLSGGYGEFVDLMDQADADDCHVLLCRTCAQKLCDAFSYLKSRIMRHVNLDIAHVCSGEDVWVSQPSCERDYDRHGWREVFVVGAASDRDTVLWVCDSQDEADALVESSPSDDLVVTRELVANFNRRRVRDAT